MNKDNMQWIFKNYIAKFDFINNDKNDENFKWIVAKEFRPLMDKALSTDDDNFADALNEVKKCTKIIIDGKSIQPFGGMVAYAKKEPKTVREMFLNLYSDDGGDLRVQENLIKEFFIKSRELHDRYAANNFRYNQDSHAVSAYLFLYDPDHHYMYKASQSKNFAKYIDFYENLGAGDYIDLKAYYKMCDWVLEQIMGSEELLAIDATRFNSENLNKMFQDTNKHVLVFDLIYCANVYDLFEGIYIPKPGPVPQINPIEQQKKAKELYENYIKAEKENQNLQEALKTLENVILKGVKLTHSKFGNGEVKEYKDGIMSVIFSDGTEKKLDAPTVIGNGIITLDNEGDMLTIADLAPVLKQKKSIQDTLIYTEKALEPYKEFLE